MNNPENVYFAKAEMLIRRPAAEVFQAFINPAITTNFWFTKSSGMLTEGKEVQWTWEMYGHSLTVKVLKIIENKQILIEWGNADNVTTVEWTFKQLGSMGTFVSIKDSGFKGKMDVIAENVCRSTEGFTLVLAGLKAFLEHGLQLNLIADRFPKELKETN